MEIAGVEQPVETNVPNAQVAKRKYKKRKLTSWVWEYFLILDEERAQCKVCKEVVAHTSSSGTGKLSCHLEAHPDITTGDVNTLISQEDCESVLIDLYVRYKLPKSFVDDDSLSKTNTVFHFNKKFIETNGNLEDVQFY